MSKDDDGALAPPVLQLKPEAKAAWVEFHDAIEFKLRRGGELHDVRDVAAEAANNEALPALFHAFAGLQRGDSVSGIPIIPSCGI